MHNSIPDNIEKIIITQLQYLLKIIKKNLI